MFQNNLQRNAKETELILSTHIEKEKKQNPLKRRRRKNGIIEKEKKKRIVEK